MTKRSLIGHEALILRLRLELGLVDLGEIERWADTQLLEANNPPSELIDIAMVQRTGQSEAVGLLRALGGEHVVAKDILRAIATADVNSMSDSELSQLFESVTARIWIFETKNDPDVRTLWDAYSINQQIDLARDGMAGTVKSARQAAGDFVAAVQKTIAP